MRRRAFTIFAALSLVLCVGTCALWASSYWYSIVARWDARVRVGNVGTMRYVGSQHGGVQIEQTTYATGAHHIFKVGPATSVRWHLHRVRAGDGVSDYKRLVELGARALLGFRVLDLTYQYPRGKGSERLQALVVPYWSIAAALAIAPAMFIRRRLQVRRRRIRGACPTCGYDLRATPERCPECGAVPVGRQAT